ncbi:MAG: fumarate/nitrate reduction transcriptional regulator Fnr [Betaproteobacteria bacterium]|nr:fumarate/nitrate reduction transcriptional regulator Fnr [Betaproteobacteria bacterium]
MVRLPYARTALQPANSACAMNSCSNCCRQGVCLPAGLSSANLFDLDELTRVKRRVKRGAVLYHNGDRFNTLYAVRSGAFKTVGALSSGREKTTGIHLSGEVMGLDAISSTRHHYRAVALEDSEVCAIPFAKLQELTLRIPELQHRLLRMLSSDIARDHGLMLLLGSMTAEQRLAAFLLSLSRRYKRLGYAADHFILRMTREDIGDYLGLALETVSRLMSRFQRDGLISTQQREVELKDATALTEIVGHW